MDDPGKPREQVQTPRRSRFVAWMLPSQPQSTRSLLVTAAITMAAGLLLLAAGSVLGPDWLQSLSAGVVGVSCSFFLRVLWRLGERV